ncbi:hypothetical protein C1H46_023979 [Malus baccata]|uniref:HAT C-terminal dimerisation domain-containing protein n=1 Tax=Malus baccata TaxID=106549 RepID=A0A540LVA7_MALBA|nr:hypothetical protein C1H46_023979 [Malus baccata]
MVEALICTQNWLRSIHVALHHEPTIEEIKFCEEVEKEMARGSSKKGAMLPPRPPMR